MTDYIIRYAEIATKGNNRHLFELIHNIKACAAHFNRPLTTIIHTFGRIIVVGEHLDVLRLVFGISSVSPARKCDRDLASITTAAITAAHHFTGTFRVNTKRMDKTFPHKSPDVNRHVALAIAAATPLTPVLTGADNQLGIEITPDAAYVYTQKINGFGGLPVGTGASAQAAIHADEDLLATLLTMKRGVRAHITTCTLANDALALLTAFGATTKDTPTPYTISPQRLKSLTSYSPATLYPLIAASDDTIHHELTHYRQEYELARHA